MKDEKTKKIIVGVTAAAVVLAAILLVYWIYQLIAVSVRRGKIEQLEQQIAYYENAAENSQDELDIYTSDVWLERAARQLLGMLGYGDVELSKLAADGGFRYEFSDGSAALVIDETGSVTYEVIGD